MFNLTLEGHAEAVRFVKSFGLPMLVSWRFYSLAHVTHQSLSTRIRRSARYKWPHSGELALGQAGISRRRQPAHAGCSRRTELQSLAALRRWLLGLHLRRASGSASSPIAALPVAITLLLAPLRVGCHAVHPLLPRQHSTHGRCTTHARDQPCRCMPSATAPPLPCPRRTGAGRRGLHKDNGGQGVDSGDGWVYVW